MGAGNPQARPDWGLTVDHGGPVTSDGRRCCIPGLFFAGNMPIMCGTDSWLYDPSVAVQMAAGLVRRACVICDHPYVLVYTLLSHAPQIRGLGKKRASGLASVGCPADTGL